MSEVIVVAGLDVHIHREPIQGGRGEFLFGTWSQGPIPTITINSLCTEAIQTRTLLHEIIEAVNELHGVGLEEHQICALETGLADTLGRNQDFAAALVQRLGIR